jgi:hypothetical protein
VVDNVVVECVVVDSVVVLTVLVEIVVLDTIVVECVVVDNVVVDFVEDEIVVVECEVVLRVELEIILTQLDGIVFSSEISTDIVDEHIVDVNSGETGATSETLTEARLSDCVTDCVTVWLCVTSVAVCVCVIVDTQLLGCVYPPSDAGVVIVEAHP